MGDRINRVVSISKMKYGWTKYGGGRHGLVKEERFGVWYCQSCGRQQTNELGQYMMEIDDGEMRDFVRVCGNCKHEALIRKISSFVSLSHHIRTAMVSELWGE